MGGGPESRPPGVVHALGGQATALVALPHSSGYHGSLGRRRYRNLTGLQAEAALLRDALGERCASPACGAPTPPGAQNGLVTLLGHDSDESTRTLRELLSGYARTLAELRRRGVVRSNNAPAGDYAEWLVWKALGGKLAENSSEKSWDVACHRESWFRSRRG